MATTNKAPEKTAANKLTEKAGLAFNINTVKANMKSYFENQAVALPMFSGSHTAMTAVIQKMAELLLKYCMSHLSKDKTGIKNVARPTLKTVVCLNADMNEYFYLKMLKFKKNGMYCDQIPVSRKEFDAMCTNLDKSLVLTAKAYNFLAYLLNEVYLDVLSTAYQFMTYAKKKTLDASVIMYAVRNRFPDNIAHDLCTEVNRAMLAVGEEVEKVADDEDKDTNKQPETGAEDSGDEGETKDAPKKPAEKGGKKKVVDKVAEKAAEKAADKAAASKPSGSKQSASKQKLVDVEEADNADAKDNEDEVIDAPEKAPAKKQQEPKKPAPAKKNTRVAK